MPLTMFTVRTDDMSQSVRVRAGSFEAAAINGATKLGMRWMKRKPVTAQTSGGNLWVVYGPHDLKSGGHHRIGQVRVFAS